MKKSCSVCCPFWFQLITQSLKGRKYNISAQRRMDAPEKFSLTNIRTYVRCTRAEGLDSLTAKLDKLHVPEGNQCCTTKSPYLHLCEEEMEAFSEGVCSTDHLMNSTFPYRRHQVTCQPFQSHMAPWPTGKGHQTTGGRPSKRQGMFEIRHQYARC